MRLLHVITNFEKRAGAEQALINLVESGLGRENEIVALRSDALARELSLPSTCRTQSLGMPRCSPLQAWRKLAAIAAEYRPDAVIGWMYHGNVAASLLDLFALRSCPVIWTIHHALDDWQSESRSTKLAIAGSTLVSRTAHAIVYVSARTRDQHRRLFGNKGRSVVIPNAVQIGQAERTTGRTPGKTVGFAARYHPTKDFRTFIRTVRQVHAHDPSVRFLACGEGASMDNAELAALARNEGLRSGEVQWLGPRSDMATFYAELDLFLLTSRAEGFGMVLAEALGHGIPCISTDVGAAREIIGNNGRIVPVGDSDTAAAAILEELGRAASDRRARSEEARARAVAQFSAEAVRAQYSALLNSLAAGRALQ